MSDNNALAQLDLNSLSLEDLKGLQKKVNKAVVSYEERQKQKALAELEAKAKEMGFTLSELTGGKPAKTRAAGPAKYRNPADASQTWTGKGRRPVWFMEAIANGATPEALEV